jgi:hypothetical protein
MIDFDIILRSDDPLMTSHKWSFFWAFLLVTCLHKK